MRAALIGIAAVVGLSACGPSYGGGHVKTPDELVAEQEKLADEQAEHSKGDDDTSDAPAGETDLEKKREFDTKQATLELQRATRSAESCAGVVTEAGPKGKATVTLSFKNDGHVKSATIDAPFDGTELGKCVLNAYQAVIVPTYVGEEKTMTWPVDLSGEKKDKAE